MYLKPLYRALEAAGFHTAIFVLLSPAMRSHPKFEVAGARFEGVAALRLGCLGQLKRNDVLHAPYPQDLSNLNGHLFEARNWPS